MNLIPIKTKGEGVKLLLLLLLAVVFQLIPFYNLFLNGVFTWHITQINYAKPFIVILATILLFQIIIWKIHDGKFKIALLIIISGLFLTYYHSLIPALTAYFYFEVIIAIGAISNIFFFKNQKAIQNGIIAHFITGVIVWTLFALVLSSFNIGSINNLRIMTAILGAMAILAKRKLLIAKKIVNQINRFTNIELCIASFIVVIVLMQFSKGISAYDHDSLWYSLRPEQVLIPYNSFFEGIGLIQYVYYYPKLMELFFVPITLANKYSFILAGNTMMFVFLIIVIIKFFKSFEIKTSLALFFTLSIISLPVINNLASTAKTDMFTNFLLVSSVFYFFRFEQYPGKKSYFILFIATLFLALSAKYSSYMYLPAIAAFLLYFSVSSRKEVFKGLFTKQLTRNYVLLFLVICVFVGINLRTYFITGYPTYPLLIDFWKNIGIDANFPYNLYSNPSINIKTTNFIQGISKGLWEYLFNPTNMQHVVNAWTGNLLFFLILVVASNHKAVLPFFKKWQNQSILALFLLIEFFLFRILYIRGFNWVYGGDGNYFMFPIILLLIFVLCILQLSMKSKILNVLLSFFIIFQFFYSYYSHPSWRSGIQKEPKSTILSSLNSENYLNRFVYRQNHIEELVSYLRQLPPKSRGIFYNLGTGSYPLNNKPFPIIMEPAYNTFMYDGTGIGILGEDVHLLKKYITQHKINYLVANKNTTQMIGFNNLIAELESDTYIEKKIIGDFTIYKIPLDNWK